VEPRCPAPRARRSIANRAGSRAGCGPRLHDRALRRDLEEALGALERGRGPRRDGAPDKG
jgi:hypothetical protein